MNKNQGYIIFPSFQGLFSPKKLTSIPSPCHRQPLSPAPKKHSRHDHRDERPAMIAGGPMSGSLIFSRELQDILISLKNWEYEKKNPWNTGCFMENLIKWRVIIPT